MNSLSLIYIRKVFSLFLCT